jgi:hypothetical protein
MTASNSSPTIFATPFESHISPTSSQAYQPFLVALRPHTFVWCAPMAKRTTKAQREQAEADRFRATVVSLLHLRHNDWNDWEFDWLSDEVRRSPSYIYTEKEHAVLDRLVKYSKSFTHSSGYTVSELIAIAYPYRFDLDEDGQEFVEKLHGWRATKLKLRQMGRLLRLCRCFAGLDARLDEAA